MSLKTLYILLNLPLALSAIINNILAVHAETTTLRINHNIDEISASRRNSPVLLLTEIFRTVF